MDCKALWLMREARVLLNNESKASNSRELSITITKLDEAYFMGAKRYAIEISAD